MFLDHICRTLAFSKLEKSLLFNFWSRGNFLFGSTTKGVSHQLPVSVSQYSYRFQKNCHGLTGIISLEDISVSLNPKASIFSSPQPHCPANLTWFTKFLKRKVPPPKKGFFAFLGGGVFCPAWKHRKLKWDRMIFWCDILPVTLLVKLHIPRTRTKPNRKSRCYILGRNPMKGKTRVEVWAITGQFIRTMNVQEGIRGHHWQVW